MRAKALTWSVSIALCFSAGVRAQNGPASPQAPPGSTAVPPGTRPPQPNPQNPAAPAPGQATPGETKPGETTPEQPKDPNAPPDAAGAANAGPDATADALAADPNGQPAGGEYTGPSVLSRGFNFARPSLPTQERFRPFAGLNALYDSGLTGPFLGPTGKVVSASSYGMDGNFGISGRHHLQKQVFELDYRGHLYYYGGNSKYNGQDHSLAAGYTRYLTTRLLISLHENAGLYSNTYAVLNSTSNTDLSIGNTSLVVSPNTESFDDRTYFSSSEVDAVYQQNARVSFNFGGGYFLAKRASQSLVNVSGTQARADTAYRITKRTTLGVYYAFTQFNFSHQFGNSDVHTVGFEYSVALSRRLGLKIRGGGSRVEVQGLRTVTLDPVVASILGQNSGIERYYTVNYVPDLSASLTRTFTHSSIGISFAEGVSPGNGLYLTSRHESESVYYDYSGIRRYSINFSGGRDTLQSVGDIVGTYSSYFGRASVSHPLARHLQGVFSADYRRLGFSFSGYGRNEFRLSLGLTFAPGEGPLKFW